MHARAVARAVALGALGALLLAAATTTPAAATPADDFDRATQLFRAHDWQAAIPLLGAVLYPHPLLSTASQVFEAHVFLGASELELGDTQTARDEFEKALQIDADRTLTPLTFSPATIEAFEATKTDVHARTAAEAAAKSRAEASQKLRDYLESIVVVEQHTYALNFAPFGLGQYQNGEKRKFVVLAAAEAATGATSVVIFAYLVNKYGISGTVNPKLDDPTTVRRLQQVEIGSSVAFYALYAYGVIDAVLHYQGQTRVNSDPSLLPPDLRGLDPNAPSPPLTKPAAKAPRSAKTSFHLGPILVPSGAGVGLAWEN